MLLRDETRILLSFPKRVKERFQPVILPCSSGEYRGALSLGIISAVNRRQSLTELGRARTFWFSPARDLA